MQILLKAEGGMFAVQVWYGRWDLNPQNLASKASTYANSVTSAYLHIDNSPTCKICTSKGATLTLALDGGQLRVPRSIPITNQ